MRVVLLGLLAVFWSNVALGRTLYTFNGGGTTGDWTSLSTWTTDPTGSTSINPQVPGAGDNVVITNSFVVTVSSPVTATSLSITVQRGGVLDLLSASATLPTLTSLSGQGKLRIGAPFFPGIATGGNNFDDPNTGTVEFYNWPAGPTVLPLPASGMYNNLRLVNSSATAYVAQLDNDLTISGSLALARTNTTGTVALNLGKATTARTLTVLGDVNVGVGTTLGVTAIDLPAPGTTPVQTFHTVSVAGSFLNSGTVSLHNGTANDKQTAQLLFTGLADASFACNGPTDLDILRVDKGTDSQVLLSVTSTVNPVNSLGNLRLNHLGTGDFLQLFNGVTKLGSNIYLPAICNDQATAAGYSLGEEILPVGSGVHNAPTLWIAGATVINTNAHFISVYGTYRISGGSFTGNYDGGMVVREDGQVLIENGTTLVNKFRPSRTSANHRGSFIITGGLFECTGTTGTTVDDKFARFSVPYVTQAFRMTGGTIRTEVPPIFGTNTTADPLFHIGVTPNNAVVTGGNIEIILPNTNVDGKLLTTAPLWNLTIKKAGTSGTSRALNTTLAFEAAYATNATLTAQPLTVLNNFTLDATGGNSTIFDSGSKDVTIQGSLVIGSGSVYLTKGNTTIFSGGQDQLLTNNGTISNSSAATLPSFGIGATGTGSFNNWTINKSAGTLTLGGSATTYYTPAGSALSLLSGVLNDGGKTINVQGNIFNSASHTSGGGSGSITMNGAAAQVIGGDGTGIFGNLTIFNTALAAGSVAVTLQANTTVASVLTLQSSHILGIGANRLSLTNVRTDALQPQNNFNNQRMIQTAGNQSDLGLQKTYGGADNFTFPVGTGTKYTPATVALNLSTPLPKYGQVSVSPVNSRSPFVASTTNSLAYYWKVRSIGFSPLPAGAINETFQMLDSDAALPTGATINSNYIGGRYLPTAWNTPTTTPAVSSKVTDFGSYSTIAFTAMGQFEGEFTAGISTTFGPITSFYSRTATAGQPGGSAWNSPTTWSTTGYGGNAVANGTTAGTNFPGPGNPVFIGSAANSAYHTVNVTTEGAQSGSLVIDRGSTLDVGTTGTTTNHNFGALPDAKIGGSGRLRISAPSSKTTALFPGGDFGSFMQYGGGTVEYYTTGTQNFTVPATSGSLTLNQYRNLWLNAASGQTITLPSQDLRIYAQLKTGVANGATTFPGRVLLSSAAAGNLRVDSLLAVQNGNLRFQGTTVRTVTVDTDVQVANGATFDVTSGANITHAMTVGGSVVNNGTLDFKVGATTPGQVGLTFVNNVNLPNPQSSTLTSTGILTDLYTLTLNKGLGRASQLTLDGSGLLSTPANPTNGWLTLTNGTLNYVKPSNGGTVPNVLTIHDATGPYLITDNAGLTVNAPNGTVTVATNNSAGADLKLAGLLQILQGTLSVGASNNAGNDLEYASAGAPGLTISGGNLYVNGQIRRTVTNLDGALRFDQSGGTIDIDGQGATAAQNNERGLFEVQGKGSIFRMSGGSLNLHRSNQKNPILTADLYLAPDSTVVTAGTVVLGNTSASVGSVNISVSSTVPLYDLQVAPILGTNANNYTNTGLLTGVIPLTLKGSLTIGNNNSYFNANGLPLNIYQNLNNNNPSTSAALNAGGFQPITTTQTTTFLGGQATQQLLAAAGNLTVFGGLVLNTPQATGTLQLGGNILTAGTLNLTKGTLDDKGYTITAQGDVLNSATHLSSATTGGGLTLGGSANQNIGGNGNGVFGNVTLNNTAGATTTANQQIAKVLNLSNGVLTIGSNLLWLSNPAANAVAGASASNFIRTNGIVADLGLRKSYPSGASNFTFPLGASTKYTPVVMNVTANAAAGTLTVQPIDLAHPSITGAGTNKISFYWKVSSTLGSPTVSEQFTYGANDVLGTESAYVLGRFYNGAWTPLGGIVGSSVNQTTHTLSSPVGYTGTAGTIDGDYTGGDATAFGVVPTFYSRTSTASKAGGANWDDFTAWTFNADGSNPATPMTAYPTLANPVVILTGHTINANGPSRGAANLTLQGTLDLGGYGANNFNRVQGTGTVRIGSALFPAGNYAAFVAPGGGGVDYTAAVQLPARDTYNNLTFSGGNNKQLSNLDLTINGSLAVASGTTVDNPTSQNITLTSATSGATLNGTFNLNDGNLTTGAALTNGGTLTLGAGLASIGTSFTNTGTLNNGAGDVVVGTNLSNGGFYNANVGAGNLTVGGTFANSGTYGAGAGKLTVGSDFSNAASGTFTTAAGGISVTGSLSNAGTYQQGGFPNTLRLAGNFTNTNYFSNDGSTLSLYGNFTNSGASSNFDPGSSGLVQFITDADRVFSGNATFFDVQKVGAANLLLAPNTTLTVGNLLTMRSGLLSTGVSGTVALTNTTTQPIVGASASSYLNGRLSMVLPDAAASIRVFPVGLGGRYRPVTITPQAAGSAAKVLVEIFNKAPAGSIDNTLSNMSANRYYRVQLQSGTINQPTVQLSFNTDVKDEDVNVPGNLRVAKSTGPSGPWSTAGGAGVFSPEYPRGYTISAASQTVVDANSFFALASTNANDNPLTGTAPLPVQLLSFAATPQGPAVRVAWATASEHGSAYFVVQRSADSRTFSDVAQVAAQGTTLARHDYTTLDAKPLAGTSYYRLRQVDVDGTTAYSGVVAVRFDGLAASPSLVAYPNPSTGQGFQLLTTNLAAAGGTVRLFDNVGRLILTQVATPGAAAASIQPAQPLASGIYLATWQTPDGLQLTTKVVVN